MKSGDVVVVALPGDLGRPRPAIVMISELLASTSSRVVVVPMTTTLAAASLLRVTVMPSPTNGLREPSQLMIDRMTSASRDKIGATIGRLEPDQLAEAAQRVVAFIGA